jgi:chromosome partitioning protein
MPSTTTTRRARGAAAPPPKRAKLPAAQPPKGSADAPKIIALCGQKGGAGKSTLTIALASEALERGERVLIVDADPQKTALDFGAVAHQQGRRPPTIVAMGANMMEPGQLDAIVDSFDRVFIDCPGRSDAIQRAALMVADFALLPCGPTPPDAWSLAASIELVTEARRFRPTRPLQAAICITRKQASTALGKSARDQLAATGLPVLASEISYRVAYQEAVGFGASIRAHAPKDAAVAEVEGLYNELFGAASAAGEVVANG